MRMVHASPCGIARRPGRSWLPANAAWIVLLVAWMPAGHIQGQNLDDLFGPSAQGVPPQKKRPKSPFLEVPPDDVAPSSSAGARESAEPAHPQEPPAQADIDAAAVRIRDLYEEDIKRAAHPQQRSQVVARILEEAKDPTVAPPSAYAMMSLAALLAEQGDSLDSVESALRAFAGAFRDVDHDGRLLAFLGAREQQSPRASPEHVEAVLRLNARLRSAERFAEAATAAELAARLIKKVDAAQAAAFRDRVVDATLDTKAEVDLAAAARSARKTLEIDGSDGAAHLVVGQYAAYRGDWQRACDHFRRCSRGEFRAAAEAEPADATDVVRTCRAADAWWKIASVESTVVGDLDDKASAALPKPVRQAMKRHAASLSEQALARGIDELLVRKEAEKRVKEFRPPEPPEEPKPKVITVRPPVFVADRFDPIENERSEQWQRFQQAARAGHMQARVRAVQALTVIRPTWCAELGPLVRDGTLPARQAAIRRVVDRFPGCADAHLCESYLHMVAGDRDQARDSFGRAFALVDQNPFEQVFCPRQLLDMTGAAIIIGDFDTAKRIDNRVLRKQFPNDPAVHQVQAMLFMCQKQPRFSDAVDKLKSALDKTRGADRGAVAANLAWIRAAAPLDTRLRLPKDAEAHAEEALRLLGGWSWIAWRSKAELRASEMNWDAAIEALAQAEAMAPLIHAEEIHRQKQCYRNRKSFEIER